MDSAFGWLGRVFDFIFSMFPKIFIVRSTHQGVRFRNGHKALKILPGRHIYWPIFTEVVIYPVVRQTVNLDSQTLLTKDHITVGVGGVIVYKVSDILAFFTETYDGEDTIRDIAMGSIARVISNNPFESLVNNPAKTNAKILRNLCTALDAYGVDVEKIALTDMFRIHLAMATWNPAEGKYSGVE